MDGRAFCMGPLLLGPDCRNPHRHSCFGRVQTAAKDTVRWWLILQDGKCKFTAEEQLANGHD